MSRPLSEVRRCARLTSVLDLLGVINRPEYVSGSVNLFWLIVIPRNSTRVSPHIPG
jgi:hypothetical protein